MTVITYLYQNVLTPITFSIAVNPMNICIGGMRWNRVERSLILLFEYFKKIIKWNGKLWHSFHLITLFTLIFLAHQFGVYEIELQNTQTIEWKLHTISLCSALFYSVLFHFANNGMKTSCYFTLLRSIPLTCIPLRSVHITIFKYTLSVMLAFIFTKI